jgi:hypothetical protein
MEKVLREEGPMSYRGNLPLQGNRQSSLHEKEFETGKVGGRLKKLRP